MRTLAFLLKVLAFLLGLLVVWAAASVVGWILQGSATAWSLPSVGVAAVFGLLLLVAGALSRGKVTATADQPNRLPFWLERRCPPERAGYKVRLDQAHGLPWRLGVMWFADGSLTWKHAWTSNSLKIQPSDIASIERVRPSRWDRLWCGHQLSVLRLLPRNGDPCVRLALDPAGVKALVGRFGELSA